MGVQDPGCPSGRIRRDRSSPGGVERARRTAAFFGRAGFPPRAFFAVLFGTFFFATLSAGVALAVARQGGSAFGAFFRVFPVTGVAGVTHPVCALILPVI